MVHSVRANRSAFRRSLSRVLAGVGACLCATTVAAYFGRFGWLFDQASQFRVQYAAGLSFLALLFLIRHQWRKGIAFAAFALLNLAVLWPYLLPARSEATHTGSPARILLCNVLCKNQDAERLRNLIGKSDPDIVVLLELTPRWMDDLKELERRYPYRTTCAYDGQFLIGMWSRLPIRQAQSEPLGVPQRPSLVVEIEAPDGRPLTLIATHPSAPLTPGGARQRDLQLAAVARRAAEFPGRLVLVGDMNTSPWSYSLRQLVTVSHLRDSATYSGLTPTWPTYVPPLEIPLDQCLTSDDLEVIRKERGARVGSDHFPLLLEVALVRGRSPAAGSAPSSTAEGRRIARHRG